MVRFAALKIYLQRRCIGRREKGMTETLLRVSLSVPWVELKPCGGDPVTFFIQCDHTSLGVAVDGIDIGHFT